MCMMRFEISIPGDLAIFENKCIRQDFEVTICQFIARRVGFVG